ncbi:MAG: flagellar assembly protein FliW [Fretibacterium sp.]|nr:flagellar assembly protein FliW [Fretibacterium sp.]
MCKFTSRYFGELNYEPDEDLLTFPRGLAGFEKHHSWLLIGGKTDGIKWLQNIEDPALALPVTAPDAVEAGYKARISDDDLQAVGVSDGDSTSLAMLVVLTIPQGAPWNTTANLRAPILVNAGTRQALQVIALDDTYSVRQPVLSRSGRRLAARPSGFQKFDGRR